jgi:hypothetical protein
MMEIPANIRGTGLCFFYAKHYQLSLTNFNYRSTDHCVITNALSFLGANISYLADAHHSEFWALSRRRCL